MRKLNQDGSLVAPLAITVVLLLGTIAFGAWAFMGRQDYKDNVEQKIAAAVEVAKVEEGKKKDVEFAEASKSPYRTFATGSSTSGNLTFQYPKTWSAYASSNDSKTDILNAYFYPEVIPSLDKTSFPLRVEVTSQNYSDALKGFSTAINNGTITATAFRAEKVQDVLGTKLSGQLEKEKTGTLVILPLRDKTIKIWTENSAYAEDFNKVVLPSVTFAP